MRLDETNKANALALLADSDILSGIVIVTRRAEDVPHGLFTALPLGDKASSTPIVQDVRLANSLAEMQNRGINTYETIGLALEKYLFSL